MEFSIPAIQSLAGGYRHLSLETTISSNDDCLEYARRGDPGKLWITTKVQTQGRGSRGRHWETGEGNLFSSLLFYPEVSENKPIVFSGLTFVASLALANAIGKLAGETMIDLSLKWPNDVLINGRKCAGILLESHQINGRYAIIIGMGTNCVWNPPETPYPTTNLAAEGLNISAELLFAALTEEMDAHLSMWQSDGGFDRIREKWLGVAAGLNEPVVVKIPGKQDQAGIFKTIDENGLFVLEADDGTQSKISAADIFLTNSAP